MRVTSYDSARKYLLDNQTIEEIVDLDIGVFLGVTMSTIIITVKNAKPFENSISIKKGLKEIITLKEQKVFIANNYILNIFSSASDNLVLNKLKEKSILLGSICKELIFGVVITKNIDDVVFGKKKKGLKPGRRFVGIAGMGACGCMVLLAALFKQNQLSAACLIAANFSYSFAVMTSYAVCADIGRNNTGTVTGAMNFSGQMGAFFLALMFGKIADLTNSFNYPLFIVAFVTLAGCMLWFIIDPTKQIAVETDDKIYVPG